MQKDVIYIDVEDDITAIIEQVKSAQHKVVALVPPKRTGVLQSAVNLRLLSRAANSADKRLVLITSNQALVALAAAAQVPVAKNLQTKPEIAEIAALDIDDGEDVIDGAQLPIGEHAATSAVASGIDKDLSDIDISPDDDKITKKTATTTGPVIAKSKSKVPNFTKFRKKMMLIIVGVLLLVGFLIWAIFFAPRATVVIAAKTTPERFNQRISLGSETAFEKETIRVVTEETQREVEVEFKATGKEERGEKATGAMELNRTSISSNPINVPAGTTFTSGSITFVSTESATLSGTTVGPGGIEQDSATVQVQAADIGPEYNVSPREYTPSVSGFDAEGSTMSGGTKRNVTIVTAGDVQSASEELVSQDGSKIEQLLRSNFADSVTIINDSFVTSRGSATSQPAIGEEAKDGSATLTSTVTYNMRGVESSEINTFLTSAFKKMIADKDDQRVYDTGFKDVVFKEFKGGDNPQVVMDSTGQIGPNIDDDKVKKDAAGERLGEIQSRIEAVSGVDEVDVKFWPFWVRVVPNDIDRIAVEFELRNEQSSD